MSSGILWAIGMRESARRQAELDIQLRKKHLRIMKNRKRFSEVFGVDVKKFYDNIFLGFDIISFDEFIQTPDGKSTSDWLTEKYGDDVCKMIRSFI